MYILQGCKTKPSRMLHLYMLKGMYAQALHSIRIVYVIEHYFSTQQMV